MPIVKKQEDVPGVPEETANLQNRVDQLEKRNKELEEELAGRIAQASSAALHNYPDAKVTRPQPGAEQQKTPQPRTGASAVAKEE